MTWCKKNCHTCLTKKILSEENRQNLECAVPDEKLKSNGKNQGNNSKFLEVIKKIF